MSIRKPTRKQIALIPELVNERIEKKPHAARFFYYIAQYLYLPFYENNSQGAPSYHRPTLVALILYGLFEGSYSAADIHHLAKNNLGAIWILGDMSLPSEKTIERVINDILDHVEIIFEQVLKLCQSLNLIGEERMYIDGTKTKANASKHKAMSYKYLCEKLDSKNAIVEEMIGDLKPLINGFEDLNNEEFHQLIIAESKQIYKETVAEHNKQLEQNQQQLFSDQEMVSLIDIEQNDDSKITSRVLEQVEPEDKEAAFESMDAIGFNSCRLENMQQGKDYLETAWEHEEGDKPIPDNKQVNFTDPESSIMVTKYQGVQQCYNNFALVDDLAHVIVGAHTNNSSNDKNAFIPTVEHANEYIPLANIIIGADAGFFSAFNIGYSLEEEIDLFVSYPVANSSFAKDKFTYLSEENAYQCPEGNILTPSNAHANAKSVSYSTKDCLDCPSQSDCTKAKDGIRRIRRHKEDDKLREDAIEKASTPEGKEILRIRKSVPEPVWGNMAIQDGLTQLHYRGLDKTSKEFKLRCIMHNLRKVFKMFVGSKKTREML